MKIIPFISCCFLSLFCSSCIQQAYSLYCHLHGKKIYIQNNDQKITKTIKDKKLKKDLIHINYTNTKSHFLSQSHPNINFEHYTSYSIELKNESNKSIISYMISKDLTIDYLDYDFISGEWDISSLHIGKYLNDEEKKMILSSPLISSD